MTSFCFRIRDRNRIRIGFLQSGVLAYPFVESRSRRRGADLLGGRGSFEEGDHAVGVLVEQALDVICGGGLRPVQRGEFEQAVLGPLREQTEEVTQVAPGLDAVHPTAGKKGSESSVGVTVRRGAANFELRDVPWIQYFAAGYALHGAYWHDVFGIPRSHGCINLSPIDARIVFRWTDPPCPKAGMASTSVMTWARARRSTFTSRGASRRPVTRGSSLTLARRFHSPRHLALVFGPDRLTES